jgi:hypothetical protein
MERQPIKSSQIRSVGYDAGKSILEIEFVNNVVYRYFDVLPETHQALLEAQSPGRYFGMQIRGKFKTEKVEPEDAGEKTAAS